MRFSMLETSLFLWIDANSFNAYETQLLEADGGDASKY